MGCTALHFPKVEASGEGSLLPNTPSAHRQDEVPSTHGHRRLEMYSALFQRLLRIPAVALVCVNMQLLCSFCHLDQVLPLWVICSIQMVLVVWG